ncbi:hypothetical protein [Deinococcus altitudinis]|uniref:hypothetical protein n=1 Tax=Deinococcus altitudinis TaxID=468914 RepID=UPI0038920025
MAEPRRPGSDRSGPDRPEARKNFALRVNPELYAALERWAADDLRSVNAQIEYLLTEAARRSGRWRPREKPLADPDTVGAPLQPDAGDS